MQSLAIIIPAFNESQRLPRTLTLIQQAMQAKVFQAIEIKEILVVDDGSTDSTLEQLQAFSSVLPGLKGIRVEPNQGKGHAIHVGLKTASTDWCLIADADSATPWDQFLPLYNKTQETPPYPIAIGSRGLSISNITRKQSWLRRNMGRTFNGIVRLITQLPFKDTQCGFKLINLKQARPFLSELRIKRFAWDVEFLMYAQNAKLRIAEVPVTWEHQDASRVRIVRDSLEMLLRVCQLRIRLLWKQINH